MQFNAAWLAVYRDGSLRRKATNAVSVEPGPEGPRPRLQVPDLPWLRDLLDCYGGDGFAEKALVTRAGERRLVDAFDWWQAPREPHSVLVVALLKISSGGCCHHGRPLTNWCRESALQRLYLQSPLDA